MKMKRQYNNNRKENNMSDEVILEIYLEDKNYHIDMTIGVQSFPIEYTNEDYDYISWYAKQMKYALEKSGASVGIVGSQ